MLMWIKILLMHDKSFAITAMQTYFDFAKTNNQITKSGKRPIVRNIPIYYINLNQTMNMNTDRLSK